MSLKIIQNEKLQDPILLISFRGWSDAGYAASNTLKYLIKQMGAKKIAVIDSEEFVDFSQNRPSVLMRNNKRFIKWPDSAFYSIKNHNGKNDLIIFLGHEPNFMWNHFNQILQEYCEQNKIVAAISIGSLLAEASHTADIKLTGNSSHKNLTKELEFPFSSMNRYEGPTGMLGIVTNNLVNKGIPHGAIWANIPYYLNSITNPKASQTILESLIDLLKIKCDMQDMHQLASKFDTYVESLLNDHPDISMIKNKIQELENLPNPDDIISNLDDYFTDYFTKN
ncbi:MAG: hypothetical protein CL779_03340 [Chloroflexi bacterium]|nr:hypothetical protein [Chloroflexota bacterium]|tara:strand:- start:4012 stop:4854 length:843 start_codon:yes stop_codon:yes gene_type:complete